MQLFDSFKEVLKWDCSPSDGFFSFQAPNEIILICEKAIYIYNLHSTNPIDTISSSSRYLELVVQAKNGALLFGVGDHEVMVWDYKTRNHFQTLKLQSELGLEGDFIVKTASSHDSTRFLAATDSGHVFLWEFDVHRKEKLSLLLIAREKVPDSLFYKDYLPADLFKYISRLANLCFKNTLW